MQNDANDRLNTYERPFHKRPPARSLRFMLPRLGIILLAALITVTIAVQTAYGCQGGNGGNGGNNNGNGGNNKGNGGNGNNSSQNNGNGGNNNKNGNQRVVQGAVKLSLKGGGQQAVRNSLRDSLDAASETLSITFNLKNIPPGPHASDLHQGSCPLTFKLADGTDSPLGPFSPGVTLPLGIVQATAGGVFNKTLTFQVGGSSGIPTDLLSSGKWFFCIHTGSLAQVLNNPKFTTPQEKFAGLQAFLKTKNGPNQVKQIACLALSDGQLANNVLSLKINGVKVDASASSASSSATN